MAFDQSSAAHFDAVAAVNAEDTIRVEMVDKGIVAMPDPKCPERNEEAVELS